MDRKLAFVSVINDLATDQRVHKSCLSLGKCGFDVVLIGRRLHNSIAMPSRTYRCIRMRLLFERGPMFYMEYNIRLFLFLLFQPSKLLLSNDLDTLLPNYLVSKIRNVPMIYDSHEYFTETPELVNRPHIQRIWKIIEKFVLKRLTWIITVNESIEMLFENKYGIKAHVIRNIPSRWEPVSPRSRAELGLPVDRKILLMQGSGINMHRGAEELVDAMTGLPEMLLLIIGGGDVLPVLKSKVEQQGLTDRVRFLPRMPYEQMMEYTAVADLGFTLDKDTNINYRFSLPNKLFDYIQAGTPVMATPLPEIKRIVDRYQVGCFAENHQPDYLSERIRESLQNTVQMEKWRENCKFAAAELCWENEEKNLLKLYEPYC
ncbi:MAG: glycosyltransferase [Bacteroidales bacterium]|nr:glycosyltransferase [Bacteroidales bacterium]